MEIGIDYPYAYVMTWRLRELTLETLPLLLLVATVVALFFLPLHRLTPGIVEPFRQTHYLTQWPLFFVLLLFYGAVGFSKRVHAPPFAVLVCALSSLLLFGIAVASLRPLTAQAVFLWQLLLAVWSLPLFRWLCRWWGHAVWGGALLGILSSHALWGIAQFILQQDLGLVLWGESLLAVGVPGVATFSVSDSMKLLRAYGPYVHPNVLGGSLILGLLAWSRLASRNLRTWFSLWFVITLAISVTFSRTTGLAFLGWAVGQWALHRRLVKPGMWVSVRPYMVSLAVTLLVFMPLWWGRSTDVADLAVPERVDGLQIARVLTTDAGGRGLGIGQYEFFLAEWWYAQDPTVPSWLVAPVHSVPVLALAEWGVVGVGLVVLLLGWAGWRSRLQWLPLVVAVLPLALFDHYLLTQLAPAVYLVALVPLYLPER